MPSGVGARMRIRTIKPEFFMHDGLFDAEHETGLPVRVAFIGLWCAADREGRFRWEPRRLGASILPYDCVDFSRVLDALTTRGFVVRYASHDSEFGVIPSFVRHQVINNRESASVIPAPEELNEIEGLTRAARVDDATVTRTVHARVEGKEGKEGNKERNKEQGIARRSAFSPSEFDHLLSDSMRGNSAFLQAWHDWNEARHDRRKRITEAGAKQTIRDMHAHGIQASIEAIRAAIASDWQGIHFREQKGGSQACTPSPQPVMTFDDIRNDPNFHPAPKHRKTLDEREAELAAEEAENAALRG